MIAENMQKSSLRRLLWGFKRELVWVGVVSMIVNLLMIAPTWYLLQVYDRVMASQNDLTLIAVSLLFILFVSFIASAEWLRSRLLIQTSVRLDEALNTTVFNGSFERYLRKPEGNPAAAFSDLISVRQFLTGTGIIAFFDLPWVFAYIAVIFLLHPLLGVFSIVFAGIVFGVTYMAYQKKQKCDKGCASCAQPDSNEYILSKLRNIEPIQAMGMAENVKNRWLALHDVTLDNDADSFEKQSRKQSLTKFVRYTIQSLTLGAGALLVLDGRLNPSSMIAANVLMSRALQPLDQLVATWPQLLQTQAAFTRLEKLLEEYPERSKGKVFSDPKGDVSVRELVATAPGRQEPILRSVSADIPAGNIVAVVGPSGSGKSTLSRCLVGVWPYVQGTVRLDGELLTEWDRNQLGNHIGYLPQDIELFDGTIAENICRFKKVESDKVIEASRRTGLHDLILRFPKGYDTQIGEAGSMLSAGQRQRLALARALYGNPSFIVLDEPNANLDEEGENALIKALLEMKSSGKTVVVVTHRLNLLGIADLMMVIDKGMLVRYGKRDDVLAAMKPPATSLSAAMKTV